MENDGLSKNPGQCVCIGWPTGGELGVPGQHQNSCLMHPDNIARDALDALRAWASDEDGIHPEAWAVYERLRLAVHGTLPPDTEAA